MRVPRYRGVLNEEGGIDIEAPLRKDTQVVFEWRARGEGFDETSQVKLRCNDAIDRGVPLPPSWKTKLRCLSLRDVAERSAQIAREGGVRDALCVVLGQPKPSPLPDPAATLQPGAVVLLGQRIEHLLVAHVEGDVWLCLGSFSDEGNPFDYTALCKKDLVRDAPEDRKRLRPCLEPGQLRELALARCPYRHQAITRGQLQINFSSYLKRKRRFLYAQSPPAGRG